MKALFNGTCGRCGLFKPGCATCYNRRPGKAMEYESAPVVLCADCRKLPGVRGYFRADARHR